MINIDKISFSITGNYITRHLDDPNVTTIDSLTILSPKDFNTTQFDIDDKFIITKKEKELKKYYDQDSGPLEGQIIYLKIKMNNYIINSPIYYIIFSDINNRMIYMNGGSPITYIKDRSIQDVYPITAYRGGLTVPNNETWIAHIGHNGADEIFKMQLWSRDDLTITRSIMGYSKNDWM